MWPRPPSPREMATPVAPSPPPRSSILRGATWKTPAHPTNRSTLWSRPYDYHVRDVLTWQAEVAVAITSAIHATVTRKPRAGGPQQVDSEAYRNYLRGRFSWNKRTEEGVTKALQIIQRELDLTMAFCGHTDLQKVDKGILLPGSY